MAIAQYSIVYDTTKPLSVAGSGEQDVAATLLLSSGVGTEQADAAHRVFPKRVVVLLQRIQNLHRLSHGWAARAVRVKAPRSTKMKYLSLCLLLATAAPLAAQTPSPKGGDKIIPEPIILNACVTAGAEKNSYMLSNVIRADQPVGTSGSSRGRAAANAFYWLDKGSKLKDHVGHQVQVTGMLGDDVDKTATKNTKDGKVEVTSERTKKVEVPEGSAAAAGAGVDGSERLSYKVKVHSVTRLPGSCQQ